MSTPARPRGVMTPPEGNDARVARRDAGRYGRSRTQTARRHTRECLKGTGPACHADQGTSQKARPAVDTNVYSVHES